MNQLILVGIGIIGFRRLLNRFLGAVGFDAALTCDPENIQSRLKPDDRTATIPIAAPADPPRHGDESTRVKVEPDGYWMRRNGRDISLHPTEYRLLRHLSRHPMRAFSRDELVDTAWWHGI